MIELADVNVLVALSDPAHEHFDAAQKWLDNVTEFATTPVTEIGFVRILMTDTPASAALPASQALEILRSIRAHRKWTFVADSTSIADTRAITAHLTGRKQVTDTHLLNLAISVGAKLATFDDNISAALKPSQRKHLHVLVN